MSGRGWRHEPSVAPDRGEADRARLRASADVDDDDAALQAYNALLSRLNAPEGGRPRTG